MEKITVKIGHVGKASSNAHKSSRTENDDIVWLSRVLDISGKRASALVSYLRAESGRSGNFTSCYATLDMDYTQLARYVAIRKVDDLMEYWKSPVIEEFVESDVSEVIPSFEMRPGKRRNGL